MSSVKTTEKEGDVSIGRHVGIGGNANVQGNVVVHMNMRVEGWLDAKEYQGSNKGILQPSKSYVKHIHVLTMAGGQLSAIRYQALSM